MGKLGTSLRCQFSRGTRIMPYACIVNMATAEAAPWHYSCTSCWVHGQCAVAVGAITGSERSCCGCFWVPHIGKIPLHPALLSEPSPFRCSVASPCHPLLSHRICPKHKPCPLCLWGWSLHKIERTDTCIGSPTKPPSAHSCKSA